MKKMLYSNVAFALFWIGVCEYCKRWCFKKAEYYRLKAESNMKA